MEKAPGEQQGKRRSKIGCSSTAATNLAAISYGSPTAQARNTTQPNAQQQCNWFHNQLADKGEAQGEGEGGGPKPCGHSGMGAGRWNGSGRLTAAHPALDRPQQSQLHSIADSSFLPSSLQVNYSTPLRLRPCSPSYFWTRSSPSPLLSSLYFHRSNRRLLAGRPRAPVQREGLLHWLGARSFRAVDGDADGGSLSRRVRLGCGLRGSAKRTPPTSSAFGSGMRLGGGNMDMPPPRAVQGRLSAWARRQ